MCIGAAFTVARELVVRTSGLPGHLRHSSTA
jgi:hypothetical protein